VLLPFIFLAVQATAPGNENWRHIKEWLLKTCVSGTALVAVLGTAGATVIGISLAWITSVFKFPGKRVVEWALVLPLAIPPYISAYVYYHVTGYTGWLQSGSRALGFGAGRVGIAIPPAAYAVFIFAATLFPYVYLIVRAFLKNQSASLFENARLLARGEWAAFRGVFLPLMFPAIAGGATLVALEILSDFGVVSYFGVSTFSTAIFGAWFGMSDADSAAKLSAMLLCGVFAVMALNKLAQRSRKYHIASSRERTLAPRAPSRRAALLCSSFCAIVLLFAVVIPVGQLVSWFAASWNPADFPKLRANAWNTVKTASAATVFIMVLAVGTVNATRLFRTRANILLAQFAAVGYAVPGAVLAMGVISLFAFLSKAAAQLGLPDFLNTSRTTAMLTFAYVARFFAIGYHAAESGFAKVGNIYGEAARTLGAGPSETFFRVELPMIRGAVLSGFVLVFVDIMKELPLTLILRPFNFSTLGTGVYDYAKNEIMEKIAPPALLIIAICAAFLSVAAVLERPRAAKKI
jgi:iron(III) transport system permease protein